MLHLKAVDDVIRFRVRGSSFHNTSHFIILLFSMCYCILLLQCRWTVFPFMFVALLQQKLLICPVWVYLQNYGILAILGYLRYYYIHLYSS